MDRIRALLWDVDGTLAETERDGHRVAFNLAFAELGLPWVWDEARYGALLAVAGGRERLLHDMQARADAPPDADAREALARRLHASKNAHYAALLRGSGLPLRGGVQGLLSDCRARGLPMGIATTTSRANVCALLGPALGPDWARWFDSVVCGEDVQRKKPDPEVYLRSLAALGIGPHEALALEDSPAGVAAARAAGISVVVTRSAYFAQAPIEGALAIGPGLDRRSGWHPAPRPQAGGGPIGLDELDTWCARAGSRSRRD